MKYKVFSELTKSEKDIIVYSHYLESTKENKLKTVDIDLDDTSMKLIKKLAKKLKVTPDAVIGSYLYNYVMENK
jgi:hypothetical protein